MPDNFLLVLILVPSVTGLIGWGTNWAAVKMIFHPREFIGIGKIGWQGILPRYSVKFATEIADRLTGGTLDVHELMRRVDPNDMEHSIEDLLGDGLPALGAEMAGMMGPDTWEKLGETGQAALMEEVHKLVHDVIKDLYAYLRDSAEEIIDLNAMIIDLLSGDNVDRLHGIVETSGARELKFIEYYGGAFGLFIGLVQVAGYTLLDKWWIMPIVGTVVGLLTNYLAIKMIFEPLEPKKYFGLITYQGMFPKRQPEIAVDYGEMCERDLITPHHLIEHIAEGPEGERLGHDMMAIVEDRVDSTLKSWAPLIPDTNEERQATMKAAVLDKVRDMVPEIRPQFEAQIGKQMAIGPMVEDRMKNMPKAEFERLIHGIFEEDEWILIAVGGVLGFIVGCLQATIIYGVL